MNSYSDICFTGIQQLFNDLYVFEHVAHMQENDSDGKMSYRGALLTKIMYVMRIRCFKDTSLTARSVHGSRKNPEVQGVTTPVAVVGINPKYI